VPLPLDTQQGEIAVFDVPFIIGTASPESEFHAIGLPYIPPTTSPKKNGNINLASIAGIKVKPSHESGRHYRIELDYAEVKEAYRTEKLLSLVLDCVYRVASRGMGYSVKISITNLDSDSELHGILKRLIKIKGEQDGSDKPATAPDSKAEGHADETSYAKVLKERDSILSQILTLQEARWSSGSGDEEAVATAQIALFSFRRDVAPTIGEKIKNQELIVGVFEKNQKHVKLKVKSGSAKPIAALKATAQFLEAKQMLEELRLKKMKG